MTIDLDTVSLLEDRLRAAMLAGDVEALNDLIDDDLVFTGPSGTLLSKADDLASHRSGVLRLTRPDLFDSRLHPMDQMVVATTKANLEGTFDGSAIRGLFAYTRLWAKTPTGWRIKVGHCSMIRES